MQEQRILSAGFLPQGSFKIDFKVDKYRASSKEVDSFF